MDLLDLLEQGANPHAELLCRCGRCAEGERRAQENAATGHAGLRWLLELAAPACEKNGDASSHAELLGWVLSIFNTASDKF
jgi:hypothetical protein